MTIDVFLILLTGIFVILKLSGKFDMSWHMVFTPMYILVVLFALLIAAGLIFPEYFEALDTMNRSMK